MKLLGVFPCAMFMIIVMTAHVLHDHGHIHEQIGTMFIAKVRYLLFRHPC